MDKEKASRKRSTERYDTIPTYLPPVPPDPKPEHSVPSAYKRLLGYKEREAAFLRSLKETIAVETAIQQSETMIDHDDRTANGPINLTEECENFVLPLLRRTGPSVSAALMTDGALDQLDKLHDLLGQLLQMQEQNFQLRRSTRDVEMLTGLKMMQKQKRISSRDIEDVLWPKPSGPPDSDYNQLEFEYNDSLLETILAAGTSASNKRNSSKKQRYRSKSAINEEITTFVDKESMSRPSSLRRQSVITDMKAKVSKWTKVKAAFKWERANVPSLNDGKSTDSGIALAPLNTEVARYLRVPSVPCTGSSADSVLSSSSGHLLSGGSVPASPGTISSASSIEDVRHEEYRTNKEHSQKSESNSESRQPDDDSARRSRSLDGDLILSNAYQLEKQNKNKTPWRKVKDIIQTHRGSLKGKSRSRSEKSTGSIGGSRDASPCDSMDTSSNIDAHDRSDTYSSSQTSLVRRSQPSSTLSTPVADCSSIPSSPLGLASFFNEGELRQQNKSTALMLYQKRKPHKMLPSDIASVPEGKSIDTTSFVTRSGRPPPSPLNLATRHDLVDNDHLIEQTSASPILQRGPMKWSKNLKSVFTGNASAPNSPSKQFEFFSEFGESEELSSGDFSEPCTPHKKLSPKSSLLPSQEEINKRFQELQQQISHEFQLKQKEWDRIKNSSSSAISQSPAIQKDDPSKVLTKPMMEDNLTADFKKKLEEWRIKQKQQRTLGTSKDGEISMTNKEPEHKKIDWHLWRTGQIKLEGQGLKTLPDEKDLPEDFQRKLDEWKRMKATGSVPAFNSTDPKRQSLKSNPNAKQKVKNPDENMKNVDRGNDKLFRLKSIAEPPTKKEVVVQTSKGGVLKFEGISRKFTRKLYEWEKARGIGPESSTFALLHPGYRPLDVDNGERDEKFSEKTIQKSPLQRSFSVDSLSPNPSVPSISHQPSSLSLNDMDDLKESTNSIIERKSASYPELDLEDPVNDVVDDEPEAVIVEVEDDYVETAAPLFTATPCVEQQTPVYRYEQSRNEFCAENPTDVLTMDQHIDTSTSIALQDATDLMTNFKEDKHGYRENIEHVQSVLNSLVGSLPTLKENLNDNSGRVLETIHKIKGLAEDTVKLLGNLDDGAKSKEELDEKMLMIDSKLVIFGKLLNFLCYFADLSVKKNDNLPEISITADGLERNVAIVSQAPTIFHGEVVVNNVQVMDHQNINSDTATMDSIQKESKKLTRNSSNGTKRKAKLRRVGSRQSSKTESSDEDDPMNIVLDAPRRVKRKTSRAKKIVDPEKSFDPSESGGQEDVVYVLKLKPGQEIEQTEVFYDYRRSQEIGPISPADSCVELIDGSMENISSNIFVKTKRKLFSPVDDNGPAYTSAIEQDLESLSTSCLLEKTETCKFFDSIESKDHQRDDSIKHLPPLPQSPIAQRRQLETKAIPPKEPSPGIKLMIAKYNQRISAERRNSSPLSSGSASPVKWRSPVFERKVREQTEKYLGKVMKSSSAGNMEKGSKLSEFMTIDDSAISKSASAGIIPHNGQQPFPFTSLARDSIKRSRKELASRLDINQDEKIEKLFRKNSDSSTNSVTAKSGAVRKISLKSSPPDNQKVYLDIDASNTIPKTTSRAKRCYQSVQPITPPLDFSVPMSVSAPTTPLAEPVTSTISMSERALKIQRAKDEFLRSAVTRKSNSDERWKNRLSQVSAGSDSSADDMLITKSASVGMIETYSSANEIVSGFISLPRATVRPQSGPRFGLSSIASKFGISKMSRSKKDLSAVSMLCRQTLMVDISKDRQPGENCGEMGRNSVTSEIKGSTQNVKQSGIRSLLFRRAERAEKLKKSKSIGHLQNDKS